MLFLLYPFPKRKENMRKIVSVLLILLFLAAPALAETQTFWIKGYKYHPLYKICQKKEIEYDWDVIGRIATLSKNGVEAKIRMGSDQVLVDGKRLIDIGPPAFFHGGTVAIPSTFANRGIDDIFKYSRRSSAYQKRKKTSSYAINSVVLDPGHGGKDPGAVGRYRKLKEKEVNLDVAKRLKNILQSHGIKVYLTRTRDKFIPLEERAEYASRKNVDFFISIHSNSSRTRWLKGFEVYYLSEKKMDDSDRALQAAGDRSLRFEEGSLDRHSATAKVIAYDLKFTENRIESKELAKSLVRGVKKKGVYTRRKNIKDARFHVLKNFKTSMPAVLVEMGYLSNRGEENLLRTSSYRQKVAQGLANGILAYSREYEKQNGFSR
jgi:N-acetylmuramoyl-L-alanine amidase